ncbi:hypothetical protein [Pirellulimonas nuda]|uniref:hypothetical protein n=1 Tax=Pirellulimonas nuda TaxID=2528009 RepID=UPI00119CB3C1|nr:hypothetical protein [Pirellulimonas nuda]
MGNLEGGDGWVCTGDLGLLGGSKIDLAVGLVALLHPRRLVGPAAARCVAEVGPVDDRCRQTRATAPPTAATAQRHREKAGGRDDGPEARDGRAKAWRKDSAELNPRGRGAFTSGDTSPGQGGASQPTMENPRSLVIRSGAN